MNSTGGSNAPGPNPGGGSTNPGPGEIIPGPDPGENAKQKIKFKLRRVISLIMSDRNGNESILEEGSNIGTQRYYDVINRLKKTLSRGEINLLKSMLEGDGSTVLNKSVYGPKIKYSNLDNL